MTLFLLTFLAGMLTIVAPCILPVVPFVFARFDQPFARSGLPLLAGMVSSFAVVGTLAAVGGVWAQHANEIGRGVAIALLAAIGLSLLVPALAERAARPLVALGARLSERAERDAGPGGRTVASSFLLGIATGLLWAPCAGPVLGLVLTTAALQGASAQTSLLLLTYAAGAAASLGLALWAGGRFLAAMKRSLGLGQWVRRGMGVAVLAAVTAVALGWDTGLLAGLSSGPANSIEENLLQRWYGPQSAPSDAGHSESEAPPRYLRTGGPGALRTVAPLPVEGTMPELAGATGWLNSAPLTAQSLRGKVVLIDFWTFACINCRNALPYVRAWADKYKDQGLVVIGVHTPELPFERNVNNVKRASGELGLGFPIAIDNNYAIWRSFSNRYWPAHYFVDAQGRIRYHHFGEGAYERSEQVIRQLLEEARQQGAQQKV